MPFVPLVVAPFFLSVGQITLACPNVVPVSRAHADIVELAVIGMGGIVSERVLAAEFFCNLTQDFFKREAPAAESQAVPFRSSRARKQSTFAMKASSKVSTRQVENYFPRSALL